VNAVYGIGLWWCLCWWRW